MQKAYKHLEQGQRHIISALYKSGHSLSDIASYVGINESTISRELKQNEVRQEQ